MLGSDCSIAALILSGSDLRAASRRGCTALPQPLAPINLLTDYGAASPGSLRVSRAVCAVGAGRISSALSNTA